MAARAPAAIGMRPHTGWTAVVALGGPLGAPELLAKRRIDVATTFDEGAVYHKGQELPLDQAEAFLRTSAERFERLATEALAALAAELRAGGREPVASAMVGAARPLPPLASILRSHPLVHAAEAELYRRVFLRASETACRLPPRLLPAEALAGQASRTLRQSPARLEARLAALGKASGKPWTRDQKEATLAAWIALAGAASP